LGRAGNPCAARRLTPCMASCNFDALRKPQAQGRFPSSFRNTARDL
jgi:hypothetical protein